MSLNPNVCIKLDENKVLMFGVLRKDKYGESYFIPKGEAVTLNFIVDSFETGEQFYLLSYKRNGQDKTVLFPCEKLSKSGILSLAKDGVDVTENNATVLLDCLQNQRYELVNCQASTPKQEYVHKQLGWFDVQDSKVFRCDNLISMDVINSTYKGEYDIKPKGSLDVWSDMVKSQVLGNTNLELAVIIGLSACVNGYIGKVLGCDNLLVHFMGESTTGKTTASMLALSTAGYPDQNSVSKESLFRTWHSTKNAMFQPLIGNNGYPVLFDEFSMNSSNSITDLVYAMTNGKDKSRLNKDAEQKITNSFQTTIISTGEASLYNKCSNNTGLLVRIVEFANVQWTESAKQSDIIKQCCRMNYGWAIQEMAKTLLDCDKNSIVDTFNEEKEKFLQCLNKVDNFSERIANKYTLLLVTTLIANETFDFEFNYDEIFQALVDNENLTRQELSTDIGQTAYSKLVEYVEIHRANFVCGCDHLANEVFGKIFEEKQLLIPVDRFKIIMQSLGFEDVKPILKSWKASGMLIHEDGKLTVRRVITDRGKRLNCYAVTYKSNELREEIAERVPELFVYKLDRKTGVKTKCKVH
jgi:hypothetical protein